MVQLRNMHQTTLSLLDEPMFERTNRPYLGMSEIGHSCVRYLWYSFRWAFEESHSSRMQRLFHRGHREEPEIISELRKIGYVVDNQQLEFEGMFGHAKGHCDGEVKGVVEASKTTHILEIKTMNEKNFRDLIKSGVKLSKPVYWGQAQLYMNYGKRTRCLFVAVNKNDDSYYIERIRIDKDTVFKLKSRGKGVILSERPPTRPYSKSWYECRYCSASDICHNGATMRRHCRTCNHCGPTNGGKWMCYLSEETLIDEDKQHIGCDMYSRIDNT